MAEEEEADDVANAPVALPQQRWEAGREWENGPISIGVCAMAKKAGSDPMMQVVNRLTSYLNQSQNSEGPEFRVVFFPEPMILNQPVEEWPIVEVLIAFFSTGFPLKKAQEYQALRNPLCANDLMTQEDLFDRRVVYRTLEQQGIPTPRYTIFNAEDVETTEIDEQEDYLQIGAVRLQKPLVEKPIFGEDHDIRIYYPRAQGGGSKRLFRQVNNRSSAFYPDEHATRSYDGNSDIYGELLQTEGTDVKVYTVGPTYAHAEARKSPVVDGKVMRNARGKEVRYHSIA
jgi:inositol hexakisphosphate/diphosphoinositol-pentakisphosphate kinase